MVVACSRMGLALASVSAQQCSRQALRAALPSALLHQKLALHRLRVPHRLGTALDRTHMECVAEVKADVGQPAAASLLQLRET